MIPRWDRDYALSDVLRAVSSLLTRSHDSSRTLEKWFPGSRFFFLRSGRECLFLVLRSMGLPRGSRVGIPLYCCRVVFEAIAAAGHVPLFLDVDPQTYGIDLSSLSRNKEKLDALVVVHTFGYPADFDGIRASLAGRKVPIIEDCATSLLSEYKGRLTGSLTEASFFSFGMDKPASVGGGAVLVVNRQELARSVHREYQKLGAEPVLAEIRQAVRSWLRALIYWRVPYRVIMATPMGKRRDEVGGDPEADARLARSESWRAARMRRVERALLEGRIQAFVARVHRLAENSRAIRNIVKGTPLAVPTEPPWGKWNYFTLPVRFPTPSQREAGRKFLRARGIDTHPLYLDCVLSARFFGYDSGCPQAEHIAATVCTVPNYAWLSDHVVDRIGRSLRESVTANH
jgi:dTDP-4-amino-4,6-dideoxygalactose transaminase